MRSPCRPSRSRTRTPAECPSGTAGYLAQRDTTTSFLALAGAGALAIAAAAATALAMRRRQEARR